MAGEKALRGLEAGTRAGYLILAAAVAFGLYKLFGKKAPVRLDIPPAIPPVGPETPPPPHEGTPTGLVVGGRTSGARAYIIQPPDGGVVNRNLFQSSFDAIFEIDNETEAPVSVVIDVDAYYDNGFGSLSGPVLTQLGPFRVDALSVARVTSEIDTGQGWLDIQFGSLMGVFSVRTNNVPTQSTSFEIQ